MRGLQATKSSTESGSNIQTNKEAAKGASSVKAKEKKKTAVTSSTKDKALPAKGTEKIKPTAKSQSSTGNDDLLKGAGLFKFQNTQELLKTWKIVSPERYDLKLSKNKDKVGEVSLSKKKDAKQLFDDGLLYEFDKNEFPQHVTFQCKTNNKLTESCDIKLFNMNKAKSYNQKTKKLTNVS